MNFRSIRSPGPFRDGGQAERWEYSFSICELIVLIRSSSPYNFPADCEVTCGGTLIIFDDGQRRLKGVSLGFYLVSILTLDKLLERTHTFG